jgi:hypothetical protein
MQLLTREDVDQALTLFPQTGRTSDGMIQFVVNLHMLHAENKPTHGISYTGMACLWVFLDPSHNP